MRRAHAMCNCVGQGTMELRGEALMRAGEGTGGYLHERNHTGNP